MSKIKKDSEYLYIDDIRALFKTKLGITIKRPSVYIKCFDFPDNTKWGRPRRWDKAKVMAWFASKK